MKANKPHCGSCTCDPTPKGHMYISPDREALADEEVLAGHAAWERGDRSPEVAYLRREYFRRQKARQRATRVGAA